VEEKKTRQFFSGRFSIVLEVERGLRLL